MMCFAASILHSKTFCICTKAAEEELYWSSWYPAVIVGPMWNGKYLAEFQKLINDDEAGLFFYKRVLEGSKYTVYIRSTNMELEFQVFNILIGGLIKNGPTKMDHHFQGSELMGACWEAAALLHSYKVVGSDSFIGFSSTPVIPVAEILTSLVFRS